MDQVRQAFRKWERHKKQKTKEDLLCSIWEVYHPKLQVYLCQFHHEKSDLADIASEILLKVFESIEKYNSFYSFSTWLYTIARNYNIDLFRKKRIFFEDMENCPVINDRTPELILLENSKKEIVRKALCNLSSSDRELIFLHFYEGLRYREISRITGIPEGTIKYRMSENKKFLKKDLERSLIV